MRCDRFGRIRKHEADKTLLREPARKPAENTRRRRSMNGHDPNPLVLGRCDQPILSKQIGGMTKAKAGINDGAGMGGANNLGYRIAQDLAAFEVFQIKMDVTEANIANAFCFGIHEL